MEVVLRYNDLSATSDVAFNDKLTCLACIAEEKFGVDLTNVEVYIDGTLVSLDTEIQETTLSDDSPFIDLLPCRRAMLLESIRRRYPDFKQANHETLCLMSESDEDMFEEIVELISLSQGGEEIFQRSFLKIASTGSDRNFALVASKIDINSEGYFYHGVKMNALVAAVAFGGVNLVRRVLSLKPNLEVRYRGNETPLIIAASHYPELVKMLVEAGANIEARDKFGQSALARRLFRDGPTPMAKLLIELGADVNQTDPFGRTILEIFTLERRNEEDVDFLVRLGARMPEMISMACRCNYFNVLKYCLDVLKLPITRDVVFNAAESRNHTAIEMFLNAGFDVNTIDEDGCSLLLIALNIRDNKQVVKLIVDQKPRALDDYIDTVCEKYPSIVGLAKERPSRQERHRQTRRA